MKLIRNLKTYVKLNVEVAKEIIALRNDPVRWSKVGFGWKVVGYGIDNVVLSNDMLILNNVLPHLPSAIAHPNGFIYVNDAFLAMDGVTQYAIILHELGHLKLGHLDVSKYGLIRRFIMRNLGFSNEMNREFEADHYSHENGGDIIHALKALKAAWGDALPDVGKREIDKRIAYIKQVM